MKVQISLRMRLVLLFVAAIVPLFGLSLAKYIVSSNMGVERANHNLKMAAILLGANQQKVADSAHQLLTAIVNVPSVREANGDSCTRYLGDLSRLLPTYANLGIINLDGYAHCNGVSNGVPIYLGDRSYFREAITTRSFVGGSYIVGRLSGRQTINFALPVLDKDGKVIFVAYAAVDLNQMEKAVSETDLPPGIRLQIVDRTGTVLASKPVLPDGVRAVLPNQIMQDAAKNMRKGVQESVDIDGHAELIAFAPSSASKDSAFFVTISVPRDYVIRPIYSQMSMELAALTLVSLLGGLIAWVIGGRVIMQPIGEIFKATLQVENGRFNVRIPMGRIGPSKEFSRLAQSFNRMADSLEQREQELASELARSQQAYGALADLQLTQVKSFNALRQTQGKLVDAQRMGRIGHWELDLLTQQLTFSDEMYVLMGLDKDKFDGQHDSFLQLIHPDDHVRYKRSREEAHGSVVDLSIEYRIITSEGEIRWLHQLGKAHPNELGPSTYRTGVVQEITARKQTELALAHSTDLLRRTGEMALIGGWELALDGMHLICSEQLLCIHEMEPSEVLTLKVARNAYPPEARCLFDAAVQAALDQGTAWDLELPMITKTGRLIRVRTQGRGSKVNGKTTYLTGVMQDITAKHESVEHLHLLEACISRLNDIVLITEANSFVTPSPRIIFVNDAFVRQTGWSREEVMGKSPRILQGPKTQRAELDRISSALSKGKPVRAELINYTKSGVEFWTELDISLIGSANAGFTNAVAVSRDITHRKLAEQAIIDSEQRYTALFENAPVPMWVRDKTTAKFLTINKAAITNYGYSAEEFLSMTAFDIRPEQEHGRFDDQVKDIFLEKSLPWLHRRKDASVFPIKGLSQPVQYGGVSAHFVVAMDITSQVKAEQELQSYLFTLQRAADAAHAITWHQTLDGTMDEVVEQARGVIGAHQSIVSYIPHNDWAEAIHAASMSEKYADYRHYIERPDGNGIYGLVSESNRAMRLTQTELEAHPRWNGNESDAVTHREMRGWLAVPLIGRNGKNVGLLQLSDKYEGDFTLQDEYVATELAQLAAIAIENALLLQEVNQLNIGLEQKVAERTIALSRQEALFRALAEQAPQVVWTAGPDGMVSFLNRTWFDLAGGELKDWTGKQWLHAVHPEDLPSVQANWGISSANQSPFVGIRRLRAKDGSYHTMSYRAAPVFGDQGELEFWVGIDADISEMKSIEEALRLSNQELEAFSYSVSHDLRSPLNTIDGFSRLLSKQLAGKAGNVDVKIQHYLSRIRVGVAQMGQLIDGLLNLAQVSRMQLMSEPVDLAALSHEILQDLQARNPERQVVLHIEDGLKAEGDGRLVKVVMENLINNAWKFTSQQTGAVISVGQETDTAGLSTFFVKDNGAGFDMAYSGKLFTPFERLHATSEFPGTGIGLATVSRVIGRHGGRIWAESAPGQGATFYFTLPKGVVLI